MKTKLRLFAISFVCLFTIISFNANCYASDWTAQITDLASIFCVRGSTDNEIYAVGNSFAYTKDGLWMTRDLPTTNTLYSMQIFGSDQIYISGENFFFGKYNPDTDVFTFGTDKALGNIYSIWGTDESHIYGCTSSGKVYLLSLDQSGSGTVVAHKDTGLSASSILSAIDGTSTSNIYVVGNGQYAAHYDGKYWKDISMVDGNSRVFSECKIGPDGNLYAVTNDNPGAMFYYNGSSWKEVNIPDGVGGIYSLWICDDGVIFIGDSYGNIYRSSIYNWNWTKMSMDKKVYAINTIWAYSSSNAYSACHYKGVEYQGTIFKYGNGTGPMTNMSFVIPYTDIALNNDGTYNATTAIKINNMSDNDVADGTCSLVDTNGVQVTLDLKDVHVLGSPQTVIDALKAKQTALIWAYNLYDLALNEKATFTAPFSVQFNLVNVSANEIFPYAQYRSNDGQFALPCYKNDKTVTETSCTFVTPFIDRTMGEDSFIAFMNYGNKAVTVKATGYTDQGLPYTSTLTGLNATSLNYFSFAGLFSGTGFKYGSMKIVIEGDVGNIFGCVVQKRSDEIGYRSVPLYRSISTTDSSYNYFQ